MASVYLETTVVSYLAARPSRDLLVAANQQVTQDWWTARSSAFDLFISQLVLQETAGGDQAEAARRLHLIAGLTLLDVTAGAVGLASELVRRHAIPPGSATDAGHIAVAAVHGVNYLLTWNMAHILNAELRPRIEAVCRDAGYEPPVLCTPAELMGGSNVA